MFRRCGYELRTWFRALLESVPGEIGCWARRHLYGFVSGSGVRVLSHVIIYYPNKLILGANVGIASNTQINAGGEIVIEDDVLVGPGAIIWSQNHKFSSIDLPIAEQGYEKAKVTIERGSWIGAGAIVLPGVCVAQGTVVAAGAVVTKSTDPFTIVGGVPAKRIGSRLQLNESVR